MLRPARQSIALHPATIQRVVIFKPCCLGDMLMATPAIRAVSQRFPDAELAVVTNRWTSPAIDTNPRLSHLIYIPERTGIWSALRLGQQLRSFRFDLGINLDRSPVPNLAMRFAGIPIRAGIDSDARGVGLSHRIEPEPNVHETDLYLSVIETLGITTTDRTPEFIVPPESILTITDQLPRHDSAQIVVIHPGGAVNPGVAMLEKRWPATNFGELAALLVREAGATIVLVGAESDSNAVNTVRDFARVPVIDLCGQLAFSELAALCQRAALFVGNDTGAGHLASAVGTPVVSIFGPTNPNRYRPLGRRTIVCAPPSSWNIENESDLRFVDRTQLTNINDVPLPQVLNASLELLGSRT